MPGRLKALSVLSRLVYQGQRSLNLALPDLYKTILQNKLLLAQHQVNWVLSSPKPPILDMVMNCAQKGLCKMDAGALQSVQCMK